MDILKGVVRNSRHSTEVNSTSKYNRGRGYKTKVYTNQVAIFDVGDRPVEFRLSESIMVNDGDLVVVVGHTSGGVMHGLAYKNLTKQVARRKSFPTAANIVIGIILILFGFPLLVIAIGMPMVGIGAYLIFLGINNQKIANEVDRILASYN
jgi:hypothetical protein